MGFIHDAIIESNQLEDSSRLARKKNPPSLKNRKPVDEGCDSRKEKPKKKIEEKWVDVEQFVDLSATSPKNELEEDFNADEKFMSDSDFEIFSKHFE